MAKITQLQPGGWGGRRYGSFAGRTEVVVVTGLDLSSIFAHYYRRRRMTNLERSQVRLTCAPTVDTGGAYASGNLIGTKATLLISDAVLTKPGAGTVFEVTISDLDNQKPQVYLVFFSADPSATTFTNRSAFDVADADLLKVTGYIAIDTTDWISFADNAVARKDVLLDFNITDSRHLQLALVAREAKTFTSADALQIALVVLQAA